MKQPDKFEDMQNNLTPEEGCLGIRRKGRLYSEVDPNDPNLIVNKSHAPDAIPRSDMKEPPVRRSSVPLSTPAERGVVPPKSKPSLPSRTTSPCPYRLSSVPGQFTDMTDVFCTPVPPPPGPMMTAAQAAESNLESVLNRSAIGSFGEGKSLMCLIRSDAEKRRLTVPLWPTYHYIAILNTRKGLSAQVQYQGRGPSKPSDKLMPIIKFISTLSQELYPSRLPVSAVELERDIEKAAKAYRDIMAEAVAIPSCNVRFNLKLGPKIKKQQPRSWAANEKSKLIVEIEFIEDYDEYGPPEFLDGYNAMVVGRRDQENRILCYEFHPRM